MARRPTKVKSSKTEISSEEKLRTAARSASGKIASGVAPVVAQAELIQKALEVRKENLPHLYGRPWYKWAYDFFMSRERMALLTAFNQASKSSTAIRTIIEWAGNPAIWHELWPENPEPRIFWYCYPSYDVSTTEFHKKWLPEFLPRGEMKGHATYGWREVTRDNFVTQIEFNSGVTIFFKPYTQAVINQQTSTVHAVFCDEEMPISADPKRVDELLARLLATRGYFRMVFTATLGEELWYRAMERIGHDDEAFPAPIAWKRSVSMYDSQTYMDGSPSPWTRERITEAEAMCSTEAARLKRIMGRFVKDEGLLIPSFTRSKHFIKPFQIPTDWPRYVGVDIGSNSTKKQSKSSIVFIAATPDYSKAYVYRSWRGDDRRTIAGDTFEMYRSLSAGEFYEAKAYDPAAADFGEIAMRSGDSFTKADKDRKHGISRIVELFHAMALFIFDESENYKLCNEIGIMTDSKGSSGHGDDMVDALRYGLMLIPFNWEKVGSAYRSDAQEVPQVKKVKALPDPRLHAAEQFRAGLSGQAGYEENLRDEIAAWNEAYGS